MTKKRTSKIKDPVIYEKDNLGRNIAYHSEEVELWNCEMNETTFAQKCPDCKNKNPKDCIDELKSYFSSIAKKDITKTPDFEKHLTMLLHDLTNWIWEYTCHSCKNSNLNKISEIKNECRKLYQNIGKIIPQIEELKKKPTFKNAYDVIWHTYPTPTNFPRKYPKTEEMTENFFALKYISEMDTGKDSTKLKFKARENVFACLLIITKFIYGKDLTPKFDFKEEYVKNEFFDIMAEIFNKFSIEIPVKNTVLEYLHRYPYNDNDELEGGFIQKRYEYLFGEHPEKKNRLKELK